MISWKLYWALGAAVLSAGVATALALVQIPAIVGILVFVGAAVAARIAAKIMLAHAEILQGTSDDDLKKILRSVTIAAAVHAVWGAVFLLRPGAWPAWLLALLVLSALEYWVARAQEYLIKRKPIVEARKAELVAAAREEAIAAEREEGTDKVTDTFTEVFIMTGHDYLTILGYTPIVAADGVAVGIICTVQMPVRKGKGTTKLTNDTDAESIAIALKQALKFDIQTHLVTIMAKPSAGVYTITVLTVDVMANVVPYVDDPTPCSISDPMFLGVQLDGTPYWVTIDKHWEDVGATRSGKTSLIHNKFAHILRAQKGRKAKLWVGGVDKLYDLVGPWLEKYWNTGERIPFDFIRNGQRDTVIMLYIALMICRGRQKVPLELRNTFDAIVVQIDEASSVLMNSKITIKVDGQERSASNLVAMIEKIGAGVKVFVHMATQSGVNNQRGDDGSAIAANTLGRTVFRSNDDAEVGRGMGLNNYKLPQPRYQGEFWFNPVDGANGGEPVHLKARYMQETDGSMKKLHDGATIAEVAWARRGMFSDLDQITERIASSIEIDGEFPYARRHRYADNALKSYVLEIPVEDIEAMYGAQSGTQPTAQEIPAAPAAVVTTVSTSTSGSTSAVKVTSAEDRTAKLVEETEAVIDALMSKAGIPIGSDAAVPARQSVGHAPPAATVTNQIEDRRTRPERIIDIVTSADRPVTTAEIHASLRDAGDAPENPQVITNALTKLVKDRQLVRPGGQLGVYALPVAEAVS